MEVVRDSIKLHNNNARLSVRYMMWKQSLHKWDEYISNRHRSSKIIDSWSQYCVDNSQGNTAVYNSGGMFFRDFLPKITVIEHDPCPIKLDAVEYLNTEFDKFDQQFDTLIMINPIALKYNHSIWNFLSTPCISRAGYKGCILNWLKTPCKIFLSFSDWHMYYDRLKFRPESFVQAQLAELEQNQINCVYHQVIESDKDLINGNVKLELVYGQCNQKS